MTQHSRLGIMQGRLSSPVKQLIQHFPAKNWQEEFPLCAELGLGCMEWIYEYPTVSANPLNTVEGAAKIKETANRYGVFINSVVADYFMVSKLFAVSEQELKNNLNVLDRLIRHCSKIEIPVVELPFVDSSALDSKAHRTELVKNLIPILENIEDQNVKVSLETSLPPETFLELIHAFYPFKVYVNYDMGNSASLGYDSRREIGLLGEFIINVHIKDRVRGGGTVPLGEGDTDFETVFSELEKAGYEHDYILQAVRNDISNDKEKCHFTETVRSYIDFVSPWINT